MQILYNNLVDGSGITLTHSTETTGYPAENVQSVQPSIRFRSATDPVTLAATGANDAFRVVAAAGVSCTSHRNMLTYSNEMNQWTATNLASRTKTTSQVPAVSGCGYSWLLTDNGTSGAHSIYEGHGAGTLPASLNAFESAYFTIAVYARQVTGQDIDLTLLLWGSTSHYVECSYDLSAGSAGTPSITGDWANASASIEAVDAADGGGQWYRLILSGEASSASNTSFRHYIMMEKNGSTSYSGSGEGIYVACATAENGTNATGWAATTTDYAAWWKATRTTGFTDTLFSWQHVVSKDRSSEESQLLYYSHPTQSWGTGPGIQIFDEGNLNGYVEIGRYLVGEPIEFEGKLTGLALEVEEPGGEFRSRGGQIYRGSHPRTRSFRFQLEYLTKDEAFGQLLPALRALGSSTPGLFVVNADEADYPEDLRIYGYLENNHPIARQIGEYWHCQFVVVEVT